jgi:hypothetical protein
VGGGIAHLAEVTVGSSDAAHAAALDLVAASGRRRAVSVAETLDAAADPGVAQRSGARAGAVLVRLAGPAQSV